MRRQTIGNLMIAGVFGIVLLAGCSTNPAPAVRDGMMTGKIKTAAPSDGLGMGGGMMGGGPGGVPNTTKQSTPGGKIYKVHITIKSPKSSWRAFFETSFNKKTSFKSIEIFSPTTWDGVRGWVKVERDGLHYKILMKDPGKPSHIVRGNVIGNQQEYLVSLNDKN